MGQLEDREIRPANRLETAGENLAEPSQVKGVRAQLEEAIGKRNIALAQLSRIKEDIAVEFAEDHLKIAISDLELYQQQLKNYELVSPIEGIVLNKFTHAGEFLMPGAPVYEIGNLYEVECNKYVPADQYGKIFLNQKAYISVDSYPDHEFGGYVIRIADEAEFTPKNIQTKEERVTTVYKVTIAIDNPQLQLKPGMPADVIIEMDS